MYKRQVPCIASNIAGPAEIIKNEETGILFNNGDSVELANKLSLIHIWMLKNERRH